MEQWQDQGIVLSARPHGESGAVVSLLTPYHGRHAGYVRGGASSRLRAVLQPGGLVMANWESRVADQLGAFSIEQDSNPAASFMGDALRLGALLSACALCDSALPERESHPGLYYGLRALMEAMTGDIWAAAYVMWEIAFLKELGFALDLSRCAAGGDSTSLKYVSPKSGRAVSAAAGEIYKGRLLALPHFLNPVPPPDVVVGDDEDVLTGLMLTGYFLEHWAFTHHSRGVPEERLRFQERFVRSLTPVTGDSQVHGT